MATTRTAVTATTKKDARSLTGAFWARDSRLEAVGARNRLRWHEDRACRGGAPRGSADQLGHSKPSFTLNTYAHLFRAARHARQARKQLQADYGALLRGASKGASNS